MDRDDMRQRSSCSGMMGREEYGEGKELLMIQSIPLHGGGSVMCAHVWLPMELVFIDDVTADKSSRMNS